MFLASARGGGICLDCDIYFFCPYFCQRRASRYACAAPPPRENTVRLMNSVEGTPRAAIEPVRLSPSQAVAALANFVSGMRRAKNGTHAVDTWGLPLVNTACEAPLSVARRVLELLSLSCSRGSIPPVRCLRHTVPPAATGYCHDAEPA